MCYEPFAYDLNHFCKCPDIMSFRAWTKLHNIRVFKIKERYTQQLQRNLEICEKSYRLLGLKHIASSRYSKVTWASWHPKLPATQRGSDWPDMAIYNQKMSINMCKNSQQINTYQYMNRLLMNFKHVALKIRRLFRYSLISATCQHDEHWTISQMSGLSHWRF